MQESIHSPIDAGNIDDDVNHVTAQLVRLHVHRTAVRGDVDLTDHVEQERLFNPRILQPEPKGIQLLP